MQQYFFIWEDGCYNKLQFSEIVYIESLKNYIRLRTSRETHLVLSTMKKAEEMLPEDRFCRIHRRYIVSLENVNRFNHNKLWIGNKQLPISHSYQKKLEHKVILLSRNQKGCM